MKKTPIISGSISIVYTRGVGVDQRLVTSVTQTACLLAADLATNTATAVDDLAATPGLHAGTESDRAASFDVADSSWVVNGHR